jgi:NitT/TauT family transport system permease protein
MSRLAWQRLGLVVGLIALLELACDVRLIPAKTFTAPSRMATALVSILASGEINEDLEQTLLSVVASVLLAVVAGFAAGVVVHALPRLRRALDPFLATYYAVPFFVFYPVMVAVFGLSHVPIVIVGFMFAVVVMLISTLNGLDRIPRVLGKVGHVHHLGRVAVALRLKLPAAAPHIFTGVKLATSYAFIGVIASEFIMAPSGLGYAIAYAYGNFDNVRMYALMLLVLLIVTTVNMSLQLWEHRLLERRRRA